ncbi:MAG TPA: amidohydrolase family protein [Casimicrobiaceae bacterium]
MSGRVDAHHHVWRLDRGDYGWLTPAAALAPIYRDFDLADLRPLLAAADVDTSVLVQAAPSVAETRFLLDVARASAGLVRGVVGWTDLGAADAVETLAALAADPLLKSVRPMLQDLADPAWIARPEVQPALAALSQLGLRFDALVRPRELKPLLRALERQPDLAVVVDHCGKPEIAGNRWQPWADAIAAIARHTRAHCKLSGLVTEAGVDWTVERLQRYTDHVLQCFGPERLLWGSDWPVVTLAASYEAWTDAADALLAGISPADKDQIFGANARRFYGLE